MPPRHTFVPLSAPEAVSISLDPWKLPNTRVRTTMRMFAALVASLVFTFTFAPLAAKSRRAALILVPALDILQSVPILGFLSFTVVFFMGLFPGRVLGLELAAIFAIFTSQAWNMAFSLYQSLTTVPGDLIEAARGFRLTGWQRFWRLEVPFGMPGLVWNMMMSMSGGWFFVVASEAISVGDNTWKLPGIGSYVALALEQRDIVAVFYAIAAMLVVIIAYDQLLFRPLVAWSAKFRFETTAGATAEDPWMLKLLRRTRLLGIAGEAIGDMVGKIGGMRLAVLPRRADADRQPSRAVDRRLAGGAGGGRRARASGASSRSCPGRLPGPTCVTAFGLGCLTMLRVIVLMILASLVWVPVGVWLGLRPVWARRVQPLAQFLAAFPANLLFPPFVLFIVHFGLNADIWLTPLMVLGTQWYILFNVVAGAAALSLRFARGREQFPRRRLAVVAAGHHPGHLRLLRHRRDHGLGRLVERGDRRRGRGVGRYQADGARAWAPISRRRPTRATWRRVVLGVVLMSGFVLVFNRVLWRPLYAYREPRLTLPDNHRA